MHRSQEERYIRSCAGCLETAQLIRQNPGATLSLKAMEKAFCGAIENYDHCFSNPAFLQALGFDQPGLLSVLFQFFNHSLRDVILARPINVWDKSDLLVAIKDYFKNRDVAQLQDAFDQFCIKTQMLVETTRMKELVDADNLFARVLASARPDQMDWMIAYGLPVTQQELDYCRFWFSLPKAELHRIARHIVKAFLHGFLSQSRDRAGRSRVRLHFALGQEALAQQVVGFLAEEGLEAIAAAPSCTGFSPQYHADHRHDLAANQDPDCYAIQTRAYQAALDCYQPQLLDTCGFIRIGAFGRDPQARQPSAHAFRPSPEALQMHHAQMTTRRSAEAHVLRPDTLSFCSVVFPDVHIGQRFPEVFKAFVKLNTQDPQPFELIQKELIDLLDPCVAIRIKGQNGNQTDLHVSLQPLANPDRETNFLNCGGDLNIPHGELFTTPQLKGTQGLLHVRDIYLKDQHYLDLKLWFEDGRVRDYNCSNFEDPAANRQHVFETLLQSTNNAPMGELSIGTNTLAFKTAKDFGLTKLLPILLAEKMGPHIAVGDPCFARGEDSPVFNLYGGKEMTARDNELTGQRHHGDDCYVNFHTDITLPYDQVGLFEGLLEDGSTVVILRDGRYLPLSAAALNHYL